MFSEHKIKLEYSFPLFADKLFCDLTPEAAKSLGKIKQTKLFQKSFCFFSKREMPRCVYILRAGRAQLRLNDINIVRWIEPNEIFGLTEMLASLPRKTSAEAITPCLCELIKREDFISFLQDEREICLRLLRLLGSNLQKSRRLFFSSIN